MAEVTLSDRLARLRPVRAVVDLDRLLHNFKQVAQFAQRPVMPVIKADAYGHGAIAVGRALEDAGAPLLAVAYPEEGAALRQAGIQVPIVVLAGFTPEQLSAVHEYQLTPVISTEAMLDAVCAAPGNGELTVHLKIDTGMSRLGFDREHFLAAAARIVDTEGLRLEGVMTHLASADEDAEFTNAQLDRFDAALAVLHSRGIRPTYVHAANSAGLAYVRPTHTLVRPGLILYGVRPRPLTPPIDVRPILTLSARITLIKTIPAGTPVSYGGRWVAPVPTRIATLPLGYADGVPRTTAMSSRGECVVHERRVPVRGTVCMDLTMIDVSELPEAREGHEAVLLGDSPTAWEVADWAGTNAWEILTSVGARVPRVYLREGTPQDLQSLYSL